MSDTLTNALAQSAHSQSVLAGIQNPTVVNPLAGMGSAITAVSGMQGLAAKQGEQLVGQALQQATDENGNLDFAKAQKIAAGMGPNAAFAMQGFLKTSSQLRGEQINNVAGSMKVRGLAAMSALKDSSDGNINTIFDNLISNGMSAAEANQERARILAMDPAGRQQEAYRYGIQSLEQMHQVIGQTTGQNVGGQIVPQTITQPSPFGGPGGLSQGPGSINTTLTPEGATAIDKIDIGNGQTIQVPHESTAALLRANPGWRAIAAPSGSPTSSTTPPPPPPNYVGRPAPAAPAAPPGVQMGGPPPAPPGGATAPYSGGGIGSVLAPTAPGPRSDITPPPNANVAAILQGMQNARANPLLGSAMTAGPGAPTAQAVEATPQAGWGSAVGTYGSTPAPAPASRPAATSSAPAPMRPVPTLGVSAPPGKVEAGQETGKQSATMGGALISRGDQAPVQKANLQNMMTDLSKLDSMGPGTDKEIFLNSVMQKLTGYGFSMNRDQVAAGNSFAKLANIAVGQQLAAIGGTDARQSLFMGSNPHLDMSKLGNERIIQMLMGNEDAIQAKSRAWTAWSQSHGDDTYRQFQDDFNRHFDPRVFQSQYMAKGGPELAALRASLEREGTGAVEKFKADTNYARDNRWIQ